MKKIIKNKKTLSFLILLVVLLSFIGVEIQGATCDTDCALCLTRDACEASKARCDWCQMEKDPAPKCHKGLEIEWPNSPMGTNINRCSGLPELVRYLYEWGISLGGLLAFIALIIAGFRYLTSIGDPTKMSDAINSLTSVFWGLILLLASWLILHTISPHLTTFRATPLAKLTDEIKIEGHCDKDADCQGDFVCTDCMEGNRGKCGDGKKEGICVPSPNPKPCDFVRLYPEPNWRGTPTRLDPDKSAGGSWKSVKAFREVKVGDKIEEKECGPMACGCRLQLFAREQGWWIWHECTDLQGEIEAHHKDFANVVDSPVKCVRLIRLIPN